VGKFARPAIFNQDRQSSIMIGNRQSALVKSANRQSGMRSALVNRQSAIARRAQSSSALRLGLRNPTPRVDERMKFTT
jgi:hypothetical protein